MQHHAVDERLELAHTLRAVGPGRPTLCGDWTTGELAAHLVLRERSVRELGGRTPLPALKRWAESGIGDYLAQTGFTVVVDQVETGPPRWSPWAMPAVREAVNLLEYVVHHEDVRRAAAPWSPRPMPLARQQAIWSRLRLAAPLTMASVPVGVELRWPSHGTITTRRARHGYPVVAITGDPVELALVAFGRQRVATVALDGEPEDVAALSGARIAI
jgi:uncharacterized protein (TIGR03085 family)